MAHILNFSGGKDSTAMLLMILEKGLPLDYIINVDTTKEFPQMYEHIEQVKRYTGKEIITVSFDFDWYFRDKPKKNGTKKGYGWMSPFTRWCTKLKQTNVKDAIKQLVPKGEPVTHYVGFAADEVHRTKRKTNKKEGFQYPLIEWGMTEKDALQYCYSKGFTWGGLYEHFDRVSCFCCPLQPLSVLKKLYWFYPELWQEMRTMDTWTDKDFKLGGITLESLEERFRREIDLEKRMLKLV